MTAFISIECLTIFLSPDFPLISFAFKFLACTIEKIFIFCNLAPFFSDNVQVAQRSYPPSLLNLICISQLKLERFQHLQHSDGQGVAGGVVGEAHLKFCDGDGSSW